MLAALRIEEQIREKTMHKAKSLYFAENLISWSLFFNLRKDDKFQQGQFSFHTNPLGPIIK